MAQQQNTKSPPSVRFSQAALLLVDIQRDFLSNGALAVQDGERILEPVRVLMEQSKFAVQVATQDWHPENHISFASRHPGRQPFEQIQLHGHQQTLWPDHCLQSSPGAELFPELPWHRLSAVIRKGMDPECDSYSGFRNNWNAKGERPSTGLAGYFKTRGISDVVICGLARDVCVRWTAEDGIEEGFRVWVVWDATQPVSYETDDEVKHEWLQKGIFITSPDHLLKEG
jgi:nicotinamidase/pyrazinamidase